MSTKARVKILIGIVVVIAVLLAVTRHKSSSGGLRIAFGAEFLTRPDGYSGLSNHYGFRFASEPKQMLDGLMYKALTDGTVDVINAFSTDGRIPAYNLFCLKDDKNFFPPYYAAPLVRKKTLAHLPELENILNRLGGVFSNEVMQKLNFQVDEEGLKASDVARKFLTEMPHTSCIEMPGCVILLSNCQGDLIDAETIELEQGGIFVARGETVSIKDGSAAVVLAQRAELENGTVLLLAAREVSGEVKVLFDLKAALLFGLVIGVVVGLLRQLTGHKEEA